LLFPSPAKRGIAPFTGGRACPREGGGAEVGWGRAEGAEASMPTPVLTPTLSRKAGEGASAPRCFSLPPLRGGRACPREGGWGRAEGAEASTPPPALTPTLSRKSGEGASAPRCFS